MNPRLEEAIRFFTREKKIMSSLEVTCGDRNRTETARDGEAGPGVPLTDHTLYDLASATKLFTGLALMRLTEEGVLDLNRSVASYDVRFVNLTGVTVEELMRFGVLLKTPGRVDEQENREQALECLFHTENAGATGRRPYSDIPAMVLKYVAEAVTGDSFYECIRKKILEPAGMTETFARVPEERKKDCVLYDLEHRIEKDKHILKTGIAPGMPHDPKARILSPDGGDLFGHAGLFSTRRDMEKFCRAVLDEKIVSSASLKTMAVNRTGRPLSEGGFSQFLGYQCYVKHPDQYFSEIPAYQTEHAIGIGGFTGNHVSIDPSLGVFSVFLGNRVYDRLTVLLPEEGKDYRDYGLNEDGTGSVIWDDGREIYSSVNYVHQKDEHLHEVIRKELGLT